MNFSFAIIGIILLVVVLLLFWRLNGAESYTPITD
jgi:hypothetical protein